MDNFWLVFVFVLVIGVLFNAHSQKLEQTPHTLGLRQYPCTPYCVERP